MTLTDQGPPPPAPRFPPAWCSHQEETLSSWLLHWERKKRLFLYTQRSNFFGGSRGDWFLSCLNLGTDWEGHRVEGCYEQKQWFRLVQRPCGPHPSPPPTPTPVSVGTRLLPYLSVGTLPRTWVGNAYVHLPLYRALLPSPPTYLPQNTPTKKPTSSLK